MTTSVLDDTAVDEAFWEARKANLRALVLASQNGEPVAFHSAAFATGTDSGDPLEELKKIKNVDFSDCPPGVKEAFFSTRDGVHADVEASRKETEQLVKKVATSGDPLFDGDINTIRDRTLTNVNAKINNMFDTLLVKAKEHPEKKPAIKKKALVSEVVVGVLVNVISGAFVELIKAFDQIVKAIKDAAQWVWDRMVDIGNAIKNLF